MLHKSIVDDSLINEKQLKQPVALYGFTETAKSLLITLKQKKIKVACVIDNSPEKKEWQLGEVPVMGIEDVDSLQIGTVIICSETYKYDMLASCFEQGLTDCIYTECGANPFAHDHFFNTVYKKSLGKPNTCMPESSQSMVVQFLNRALDTAEGDILELGTAAGGATFLMATLLEERKEKRKFTTVDLFQATSYIVPCYEEVSSALKRFPFVEVVQDDFTKYFETINVKQTYSFCLYDAHISESVLLSAYVHISDNGILMLDNYGQGKQEISKLQADKALKKINSTPIILPTGQAVIFK